MRFVKVIIGVVICVNLYLLYLMQVTNPHRLIPDVTNINDPVEGPCPKPVRSSCGSGSAHDFDVTHRRRVAFQLSYVARMIARVAGMRGEIDAEWSVRLRGLVDELCPSLAIESNDGSPLSNMMYDDHKKSDPTSAHHVCPAEVPPQVKSDVQVEKCTNVPAFSLVVTAVLPAWHWLPVTTNLVISQLRKYYDLPIVVLVNTSSHVTSRVNNLTVLTPTKSFKISEADLINQALININTPFVFVGLGLNHFNNQSSLERLVRVLESVPQAAVAGGSARDVLGHWQHGCLQKHTALYQSTYTRGYYHSRHECMYCDDLLTPFMTSTALLHRLSLTSGLNDPILYRHWMTQVRATGYLILACPDVMFYVKQHVNLTRHHWQPLAKLQHIQTIMDYTGHTHKFECKEVEISCRNPAEIRKMFFLPPCCVSDFEKYLGYIIDYGEQNAIHYELHCGSGIAAIKQGGHSLWDHDEDIIMHCHDFSTWWKMGEHYLKPRNCYLKLRRKNEFFKMYCSDSLLHLDVICGRNWTDYHYLPSEFTIPTKMLFGKRWTNLPPNPGLITRHRYGLEYLKHEPHPLTFTKQKGGYRNPGPWNKCTNIHHHSCQDRYPGDGNLPFIKPFLFP